MIEDDETPNPLVDLALTFFWSLFLIAILFVFWRVRFPT
jgi:hypothetical protein